MNTQAKIFIIDDDAAVRNSLLLLLGATGYVVETFASAKAFLDSSPSGNLGCIILDVKMPDMDGPSLQEELLRRDIQLPVIFLTGYGSIQTAVSTIKKGAKDFLTKPVDGLLLLEKVREALQQSQETAKQLEECQSAARLLEKLTDREREIMVLAVAGHTNKEIGQILGISYRTVEIHRSHVMHKTGAANPLELARIFSLSCA